MLSRWAIEGRQLRPCRASCATASVPPRSAARSRIPAIPKDIGFAFAASVSKPAPLSETFSLIVLIGGPQRKVYEGRLGMFGDVL